MNLAFVHIERAIRTGVWICDVECRPVQGADRSAAMLARVEFIDSSKGRRLVAEYDGPHVRRAYWASQGGHETPFTTGAAHVLRGEVEQVLGITPDRRRYNAAAGHSGRLSYPVSSALGG
ncbi:hypothetical protein L3Y21_gp012 [Gordonia phage Rabbitrun]|uniref:Uncharacterized protein n=1 Tax=Gordonia phage Rabbitrun TaxID=2762280 RepID=A0A7G8LII4_9CAUD|nr:hypothetical protein L3Y21_gp012 [Gordonia phage Rabbitrun]QNJ57056.1 hypothetical protein SEA_RABBITRUN_12 [Gordonia phage Rabbitrun]